jgi:predicted aspartyl protease
MGMVYAEITLKNALDIGFAREGYIKAEDIRSVTVEAIADTGAMYLTISEELRQKLGLAVIDDKIATIANGQRIRCGLTDAVEVHWKDRFHITSALVIPGAQKILMGALALEGMDLMVNPVSQEVTGVHGDNIEVPCYQYQ